MSIHYEVTAGRLLTGSLQDVVKLLSSILHLPILRLLTSVSRTVSQKNPSIITSKTETNPSSNSVAETNEDSDSTSENNCGNFLQFPDFPLCFNTLLQGTNSESRYLVLSSYKGFLRYISMGLHIKMSPMKIEILYYRYWVTVSQIPRRYRPYLHHSTT